MKTDKLADIIGSYDQRVIKTSYDHMNHRNPLRKTANQVDNLVDYLLQRLGSEAHIPFYRKVCWNLSDDTVRRLVATSVEKSTSNPRGYFVACVKREKAYYGN